MKKSLHRQKEVAMSIANVKQSALGLPNLGPTGLITKILISAAAVLGSCVVAAAPASANPASADPNPFSTLSCDCAQTVPAGNPAEEIQRGIHAGLATSPRR